MGQLNKPSEVHLSEREVMDHNHYTATAVQVSTEAAPYVEPS
jgi:hypothetical protein